jgi:diacylglycerol kinase
MIQKSIGHAFKGFRMASKAAKAFEAAHAVALAYAATALVVGGVKIAKKMRDIGEDIS